MDQFLILRLIQIDGDTITVELTVRGDKYMHYYNDMKMDLGDTFTFWDKQPSEFHPLDINYVKVPRSITDNLEINLDD